MPQFEVDTSAAYPSFDQRHRLSNIKKNREAGKQDLLKMTEFLGENKDGKSTSSGGGGGGGGGFGMSAPTNQGGFGQCATYAFSRAIAESLRSKYAVSICENDIRAKIEYALGLWNGATLKEIVDGWEKTTNDKATNDKFSFADQQRSGKRYSISLDNNTIIKDINQAYTIAQSLESELMMVAFVYWPTKENSTGLHAIVIDKAYQTQNTMRGLNSHGINNMIVDVDDANFHSAFLVNPEIKWVKNKKNEVIESEPETLGYKEYLIKKMEKKLKSLRKLS